MTKNKELYRARALCVCIRGCTSTRATRFRPIDPKLQPNLLTRLPPGLQIPFRPVGSLVISVGRMIGGNVFRFFIVYAIILTGFAFGLCLLTQVRRCLHAV